MTTNAENLVNEKFQDRIASFSTHRVIADDTTELPLCLVQDKYRNIPEGSRGETSVCASAVTSEIKMETHVENSDTNNLDTDKNLMYVVDSVDRKTETIDFRKASTTSVGSLTLGTP